MQDFLAFARDYGLALAFLVFALVTGSLGYWSFRRPVDMLLAAKDAELLYREQQIKTLEAKVDRLEALVFESQERADRALDLADAPRLPLRRSGERGGTRGT